jgi:tetrahydromethanopterin S-methyltransferase subunit H
VIYTTDKLVTLMAFRNEAVSLFIMNRKLYISFILLILVACASDADSLMETETIETNPMESKLTKANTTDIEIYISNGKKQCLNNALSIDVTKGYLDTAGINVSAHSCGLLNGVMYPSVCGGATGQVHVFTIEKSDLDKAKVLGFTAVSETRKGIIPVECESFGSSKSGLKFKG